MIQSKIVQYIRDKKNNKTGLILAFKSNDKVHIGWSKVNTKLDIFDKEVAFDIATGRAFKNFNDTELEIPVSLVDEIRWFCWNRVTRYFKDGEKPVWFGK